MWIDGRKNEDLSKYQLRFTTADSIGINRAWADIHYGGKYVSPKNHHLYLDNFHVSTGPTPWSGQLVGDSTWSDSVLVHGDLTVPAGVTLTITEGTEVRFVADSDATGDDANGRPDLIVSSGGTLTVGRGELRDRRPGRGPRAAGRDRGHGDAERGDAGQGAPPLERPGDGGRGPDGHRHPDGGVRLGGSLRGRRRDPQRPGPVPDGADGGLRRHADGAGAVFGGAVVAPPWWYGIYVARDGRADLTRATVRDGLRCVGGPGSVTLPTRITLTNCASPPGAPGNLTAVPDDKQMSLNWTAAASHEALPVLGYQVRHYRAEAAPAEMREAKWEGVPGGGSARDTTLSGLTNGTAYVFRVLAENEAGAGGPRAEVTATPLGPPGNLRAEAGDGQVTLRWDDPSPANPTIAQWQYCRKPADAASCEADSWQTEKSASARQAVVTDLDHGQAYEFEVRAVNTADQAGPAASASAVLHEVTFNSTGYVLIEGGEPVPEQAGSDTVEVMVLLTPAPPSAAGVAIPLTVGGGTAAEADYEVWPPELDSSRVLIFPRNQTSRSCTLVVKADADTTHETVLLGFGDLPAGVRSGERATATVTLYDTPNAPTNVGRNPAMRR